MDIFSNFDFNNQTITLEDGSRALNLPTKVNVGDVDPNIKTVYDLFKRAVQISNNADHLIWRDSVSGEKKVFKYEEVDRISHLLGTAFLNFLINSKQVDDRNIGIYSKNRAEWVITDIACNKFSLTSVPLYDTLGEEAIKFIINQTQMKVLVCDDNQKVLKLLQKNSNLGLAYIVQMNSELSHESKSLAEQQGIKLYSFDTALEIGRIYNLMQPQHENPPRPEDLFTICYTSGTTGLPKGVMLTHENVISVIKSINLLFKPINLKNGEETHLSYLPLAHMFERMLQLATLYYGSTSAFFQGDIRKIAEDFQFFKPTMLGIVPRLLNKLYALMNHNIESLPDEKKGMFKKAYEAKEKELLATRNVGHAGLFAVAFQQIRDTFGGRVKVMATGSAPISPNILNFFRVTAGCHVIEGFGATETGGVSGVQTIGDTSLSNVGPPLVCCRYKLADVSEMSIVAQRDQKGEILIKGSNVMKGYYKEPEKTKAVLDSDGWYHTGDVGSFDKEGRLKIVDRVKHIFKLSQGEYIAPEKIENIYLNCPLVSQVFIYGNSLKSSLVGIIVPEEAALRVWCSKVNIPFDMKQLCKSPQLKGYILKSITDLGKANGLNGFEQVVDIYVHDELFSVENNLLTSTLKSKRFELYNYFKNQIDEMYSKLD